MWFRRSIKRKLVRLKKRRVSRHYVAHRELARSAITERVHYWNREGVFVYNRIAIKNQKRCWGSCSAKKNLNFNYRIIFLPAALMDYVIVHELCHLTELNHSKAFWDHVERLLPEYREMRRLLRTMLVIPETGFPSSVFQQLQVYHTVDTVSGTRVLVE